MKEEALLVDGYKDIGSTDKYEVYVQYNYDKHCKVDKVYIKFHDTARTDKQLTVPKTQVNNIEFALDNWNREDIGSSLHEYVYSILGK